MRYLKRSAAVVFAAGALFASVSANAAMEICYDGATHWYTGEIYSLYVNGSEITSPMEPIIFNDHALVPVREIFEACGAAVDYTGETQCVEIEYDGSYIRMYINDNYAYINGKKEIIPDNVVPKLINKPGGETKTMVPVRFISETVGMGVDFDSEHGRIDITSDLPVSAEPETPSEPAVTEQPSETPALPGGNVTGVVYNMLSDTTIKLTVTADTDITGRYSHFTLEDPERIVLDIANMGLANGEQEINVGVSGIESVRTGTNGERARTVIDLEGLVSYDVVQTSEYTVELTAEVKKKAPEPVQRPVTDAGSNAVIGGAVDESYKSGIVAATEEESKMTIMLDAGHGGEDPGAIGSLDGNAVNEKDLTLTLAYKVKDILESNGYKTSMTRTGDTLPSLTERPEQANAEGCALFVSIHINSADAESAHGTEVYWSEENNGDGYGITSEEFAGNVLETMLKYMGSYDRGVKMANWAVTRRSEMPAILVEVGFISNEDELRAMCDDDYQNKVAKGIAEGIINSLHKVDLP